MLLMSCVQDMFGLQLLVFQTFYHPCYNHVAVNMTTLFHYCQIMSSLFMDELSYESSLFCSPGARTAEKEQHVVTENDLEHLLQLLERKDGEIEWQTLMEKSTPNMTYQAWRSEPEVGCHLLNTFCRSSAEKMLFRITAKQCIFWTNQCHCLSINEHIW